MSGLAGALTSEWLKLRKRPAIWVLAAVLLALVILLGYFVGWFFIRRAPASTNFGPGVKASDLLQAYYPHAFVRTVVGGLSQLGGALALIMGVLTVGSEYGWGTMKTLYTQRPGRLQLLAGRLLALVAVLAIVAVAFLVTAAAGSLVIGQIDGAPITWPPIWELVRGFLYTMLIWGWDAMLGVALAFLFRQSALAIGLGLVYVFVIDAILFSVLAQVGGGTLKTIERFFPGPNGTALVQSLGSATRVPAGLAAQPLVGPGQAALVLGLYIAVAIVVSAVVARRRDEI